MNRLTLCGVHSDASNRSRNILTSLIKTLSRLVIICLCVSQQASASSRETVLVLNSNSDSISRIDPGTYKEIDRIYIGKSPHHLLPVPDGSHLIVGNANSNELVVLDSLNGNIVKRIPHIADPYHIGFSPDGKYFVVNGNRLDHVDIYMYKQKTIDFELVKRMKLLYRPSHMAFNKKNMVFITLQDSDRIVAIDLEKKKEIWFANTGRDPAGIWVTPDQKHLLVANTSSNDVDVFDINNGTMVKKIVTGKGAHNFLPTGDGKHLFISNRVADTVAIINMETLTKIGEFRF